MAKASKEKVMSVELAIQRELAYRKKKASLRLLPSGDSMEDLLPLQVPSSSPGRSERPKPKPGPSSTPGSNMRLLPTSPHQWKGSSPSSEKQSLATSRPPMPKQGVCGIKRKADTSNLQCLPPRPPPASDKDHILNKEGSFFCNLCHVSCAGATNVIQHLKGHKHKSKLQLSELSKGSGREIVVARPRCELCQIWCTDEQLLVSHLKGRGHRAKLKDLEFGRKVSESKRETRPWCELCNIWCMNEDAYQQHLAGQNHLICISKIEGEKVAKVEVEKAGVKELEWETI